ncbi:hypothetical protein CMQ_6715 [Grosmannia clavigera kw1407]|uniref:Uncharacterized protein n=1 Tax=Grosmannia clavigera (strain kw1407 / UAMH 11150) TaxID=655863 RepID=F0X7N9_GROCL|nr:uncharacterized protein CMQ_6715 [Grosmannia clavigera kw1407]EFX06394.1 hypothetical protein CMQ_6715 [Grosmannia clavigera kw1407]
MAPKRELSESRAERSDDAKSTASSPERFPSPAPANPPIPSTSFIQQLAYAERSYRSSDATFETADSMPPCINCIAEFHYDILEMSCDVTPDHSGKWMCIAAKLWAANLRIRAFVKANHLAGVKTQRRADALRDKYGKLRTSLDHISDMNTRFGKLANRAYENTASEDKDGVSSVLYELRLQTRILATNTALLAKMVPRKPSMVWENELSDHVLLAYLICVRRGEQFPNRPKDLAAV